MHRDGGKMRATSNLTIHLALLLLMAFAGAARRPFVRAPRDAGVTGDHLIVAEGSLSRELFRELVARVSRLSAGATVHGYVENIGKVICATLSPYALEMVSQIFHFASCFWLRRVFLLVLARFAAHFWQGM